MSRMKRLHAIFTHSLFLLALMAAAPGVGFAQVSSAGVPENANAKSYGSGWECDRGYRAVEGACVTVIVPENGYFVDSTYGSGWACDRGYRAVDEACVAVKVPENGYFVDSSYGSGWACDRGYKPVTVACVTVKVPENAHFDYSGNDWACNRPYRKQQDRCVLS